MVSELRLTITWACWDEMCNVLLINLSFVCYWIVLTISLFLYSMATPPYDRDRISQNIHVGEDGISYEGSSTGESLDAIRLMARELANMLGHFERPRDKVQNEENWAMVALEKPKKLFPPTFNGISGSDASDLWFDQIERAFVIICLLDDLKLNLDTYQ